MGRIYACGGFRPPARGDALGDDGLGKSATVPLKSVERYDQLNCTWKTLPAMSEVRGNAMGVVVKGRLFIIGGYNMFKTLKAVEIFDPTHHAWSTFRPLVEPRMCAAVCELKGTIFILGGKSHAKGEILGTVEWITPAEGPKAVWDTLPNMRTPRYGFVAAGFGEPPRSA